MSLGCILQIISRNWQHISIKEHIVKVSGFAVIRSLLQLLNSALVV